jgi:pyruvate dehydrogenase E2 component (dihydrolipoamide acetyltransferase)
MDVKLPNLGEGADSGSIVALHVKEGDTITKGQTILDLENEKAVAPIPSPAAGKITRIAVKEGSKISVGQVILSLEAAEVTAPTAPATPAAPASKAAPSTAAPKAEAAQPSAAVEFRAESEEENAARKAGLNLAASPTLRRIARDLGIDLGRVKGTAAGGRITNEDVRAYITRLQDLAFRQKEAAAPQKAPAAPESIDFSKWGSILKKPMSGLRQTISRRMVESWTTIPHVTQFDEADITDLNTLRKKHAAAYEKQGARLTLTSFALKAVVQTLKKFPIFNSSIDEAANEIVIKEYFHIGLAVDTEGGLLVPVIRDVDKKNLLQLSKEINEFAEKARERKVGIEDMKGGTFTISNQGGIGGAHFTPIVNKPEVAILGLGRGQLKPVVRENKVEPRLLMPICISYDHRIIDGGTAARFSTELVQAFQSFKEEDLKL